MTITNELLDELLKGCARPEDLLGEAGLMSETRTVDVNEHIIIGKLPLKEVIDPPDDLVEEHLLLLLYGPTAGLTNGLKLWLFSPAQSHRRLVSLPHPMVRQGHPPRTR